ncbi:MAG: sulfite exporter TauE/SafE family protein [Treponema sp.]|jgi:sulfite exporter TauE/SafE/copper chaperone CopZ/plastocyanin domain-containing protein|nr:sulfite exporter TauE/SafE family protein [Treponema sp.]
MKTQTIRIGGMSCVSCQNRIEKKLKNTTGVEDAAVDFNTGTASVTYNPSTLSFHEIRAAIEELDYKVLDNGRTRETGAPALEIAGTLVIILALYALLRGLGISTLSSAFPLAEAGMGYGILFIIGLVTSLHCTAMCGGINLSQCIPAAPLASAPRQGKRREVLFPALLYNAGRVISYTAVGIVAGALGSAVTVSGRFQGMVQLFAGLFMVIMGINMLGFFPALRRFNPRMPKIFARKIESLTAGTAGPAPSPLAEAEGAGDPRGRRRSGKGPLFIGLLNGLMPCGPLQAMQLYALSTGSPVAGGVSMFLFSAGTVPLMFGIGALGSVLSAAPGRPAFARRVMKAGAILVTVMGVTMFTYGFNLSGFTADFAGKLVAAVNPFAAKGSLRGKAPAAVETPRVENGVQIVNSTLSGGRYPAITVQAGIPVKWIIEAPPGSINGCNNRMIIREYKIEHRFRPGENVIEFSPVKTGKFPYSCWMGMIRSSITVVEEGQIPAETDEGGPSPAGVAIPTDRVTLAEIQEEGYQTVKTNLRDDGIDPAIIVVQKGLPVSWLINNDSLDPGNGSLLFPAYYTRIDMVRGDNEINFVAAGDFDFSSADNVFYGYVKVVDNLNDADIETIKAEVSAYETLIYPEAYFERADRDTDCCGQGGA